MKTRTINLIALIVGATLLLNMAAAPSASLAYDPSGEWAYEVPMPDGTNLSGKMTIEKEGASYKVIIYSDVYGTLNLKDVTMEEITMEANTNIEGDVIDFSFEFDGNTMEGEIYTPDGTIEMTAERQ